MSDPREPDMSKREALLVHIEGLQATLTKRNARIAELEAQLTAGSDSPLVERASRKAYRDGWEACAGHLMEATRVAAIALGKVRGDAWQVYLEAEKDNEARWSLPKQGQS